MSGKKTHQSLSVNIIFYIYIYIYYIRNKKKKHKNKKKKNVRKSTHERKETPSCFSLIWTAYVRQSDTSAIEYLKKKKCENSS